MAKEPKVSVGKVNKDGVCNVVYTVPHTGYREFLNTDKSMMASVCVDENDIKINDCYKIAVLDFYLEDYHHFIKSEKDVEKARTKIAKERNKLHEKLNKLSKAVDVMRASIDDRVRGMHMALDQAEKQIVKESVRQVTVHLK